MGELKAKLTISTAEAKKQAEKFRKDVEKIVQKPLKTRIEISEKALKRLKEISKGVTIFGQDKRDAAKADRNLISSVKKRFTAAKSTINKIRQLEKKALEKRVSEENRANQKLRGNRIASSRSMFNEIERLEKTSLNKRRRAEIKQIQIVEARRKSAARAHLASALGTRRGAGGGGVGVGGVGGTGLTPAQRAERQREQNILSKRSSKATQSIFQVQQAIEDFSFAGFRGASNNIAFLAAQFGGKGGIIALVGLAAASFGTMAFSMSKASKTAKETANSIKLVNERLSRLRKIREASEREGATKIFLKREDIETARGKITTIQREIKIRKTQLFRRGSASSRQAALESLFDKEATLEAARTKVETRRAREKFKPVTPGLKRDVAQLKQAIEARNKAIIEAGRQGEFVDVERGFFGNLLGDPKKLDKNFAPAIQNIKDLQKELKKLSVDTEAESEEMAKLELALGNVQNVFKNLSREMRGFRLIEGSARRIERLFTGEARAGLKGFAGKKFDVRKRLTGVKGRIGEQRSLLEQRIAVAAGDIDLQNIAKEKFQENVAPLFRAFKKLRAEKRAIEKEEERRGKFIRERVGLSKIEARFEAKSAGKIQLLQFEEQEKKRALAEEKRALERKFQIGVLIKKQFEDESVALENKLRVILRTEESLKKQLKTQNKAAQDTKKATRDAARDAERLDRQLAASKSGFAASIFGARLGFAAKVTEQQQGRAKQFARFRGLGGGQDKNIERFFGRIGKSRERGIVRGRLLQLTGEARAAGAAGKPEQQVAALKQRQQLEFQRSAANQNLNSAFKFLQAAQRTQEEIERIFTRRGAGQIQMSAAQIQLQAAKMQLAAVGGGAGGAFGAAAIAGVGGVAGGPVVAKRPRIRRPPITDEERQKIRADRAVQRQGVIDAHRNRIDFDFADKERKGRLQNIQQRKLQFGTGEQRKQRRLQDIERRRQFWDNFKQNGANFLFGPVGQSRQQGGNIRATNIDNTDNSSQIGNIIQNFNGEVNPQEIASLVTREVSASRMRRGRAGKRGTVS